VADATALPETGTEEAEGEGCLTSEGTEGDCATNDADSMEFMSEDNKRLVTYFEDEFDCMGLCQSNLFYWTKPISEGMP